MSRWLNSSGVELKPGDAAHAPDGRALSVVRVASLPDGTQELLAVGNFSAAESEAVPADSAATGVAVSGPLPLPYILPD